MYQWRQWSPIWSSHCEDAVFGGGGLAWAAHSTELVEPETGKSPTRFWVGGTGAPTSWAQLQPPSRGRGPRYPCTLGDLGSPCPHRFRSACLHCMASPYSQCRFNFKAKLRLSDGAVTTRPGVPVLRTALTHHLPVALAPSELWAPMSMGARLKGGWGQLDVNMQLSVSTNSLGTIGTLDSRFMVVGDRQSPVQKGAGPQ